MKCYHCDTPITLTAAPNAEYVADWPNLRIIDAIAAEKLSGEWLDRFEGLPNDDARRAAMDQLRQGFNASKGRFQ